LVIFRSIHPRTTLFGFGLVLAVLHVPRPWVHAKLRPFVVKRPLRCRILQDVDPTFSVWTGFTVSTGKRVNTREAYHCHTCARASSEQARDPMTSSSAKFSPKTSTLGARISCHGGWFLRATGGGAPCTLDTRCLGTIGTICSLSLSEGFGTCELGL
jgi:hypothetical protein